MPLKINKINIELACDTFYYDESSKSCLKWKIEIRAGKDHNILVHAVGDDVGSIKESGYYLVRFNKKSTRVHRLVYTIINKIDITDSIIDHIDGNRSNNLISNLRVVTPSENQRNRHLLQVDNISGVCGIYWENKSRRWRVEIKDNDYNIIKKSFTPHLLYPEIDYPTAIELAKKDAEQWRISKEIEFNYRTYGNIKRNIYEI